MGPTTAPGGTASQKCRRVQFELGGDAALRQLRDPPEVSWRAADDQQLLEVFIRILEASIDPRDAAAVRSEDAGAAAERMLADAQAGRTWECEREWWWIVALDTEPVGFVLPVIFTGCARGALDEGTIFYLGVVPEQRCRGLGRLLLGRATDTLLAHGVWQITCDTAAENAAMIRLFERQGWTRRPPTEVSGPQ